MPSANIPAKIMPIAVSSLISELLLIAPIPSAATMAVPSAHQNKTSRAPPLNKYPSAIPGRMVCATASPKNAMPRKNNICSNHRTDNADKDRGNHAALHEFVLEGSAKQFNEHGQVHLHHSNHPYLEYSAHRPVLSCRHKPVKDYPYAKHLSVVQKRRCDDSTT